MSDHKPITCLSLGGGVQSSALLLLSMHGEISRLDFSVFADTQHEPRHTTTIDPENGSVIGGGVYGWIEWLGGQGDIPIHTVTQGDLIGKATEVRLSARSGKTYIKGLVPAFMRQPGGKIGLLGRKCTLDYKIVPIRRFLRDAIGKERMREWRRKHRSALKELTAAKKAKLPTPIEAFSECQSDPLVIQWIGISTDEASRMKDSVVPYIRNEHPLIDLGMSREDCKEWMRHRGYPDPPRSACTGCPFHSDEEWLRLKQSPEDFASAVRWEEELQAAAAQTPLDGVPFLHSSCKPINEVDFRGRAGYQQLSLFGNECEGLCGV